MSEEKKALERYTATGIGIQVKNKPKIYWEKILKELKKDNNGEAKK